MPSKLTTIQSDEISRMSYSHAKDFYAQLPEIKRPTTVAGRKTRKNEARVFIGACHDWNKGRYSYSSTDATTSLDNESHRKILNLDALKDKLIDRAKLLLKDHENDLPEDGVAYVSTMDHPLNPTISGDVHVITFPGGIKKVPELHRLEFGTLFRILRERENKSCKAYSKETGLSVANIWNLENEKTAPRLDTVARFVNCLNLSDPEFNLVCLRIGQLDNFEAMDKSNSKKKAAKAKAGDSSEKKAVKEGWCKRKRPSYGIADVQAQMEDKLELAGKSDVPAPGSDNVNNPSNRKKHG